MPIYSNTIATKTYSGTTYAGVTGGTLAGDSASYATCIADLPSKYYKDGLFVLKAANGFSGTIGIQVVGGVNGATYVIAGRTGIAAIGCYPIPVYVYGASGNPNTTMIPKPYYAQIWNTAADVACFTVSLMMAGEY